MKCPVCKVVLTRTMYEGFSIFHCASCRGHLLARERVEFIRGRRGRTVEALMEEISAASGADSLEQLKCPGCARAMEKQKLPPPADFYFDECRVCKTAWYDGGELARLQLSYQISEQGKQTAELQRRMREMSAERRAELEANLAALPDAENEIEGMLRSALGPRNSGL